jgi:hypothetical protein
MNPCKTNYRQILPACAGQSSQCAAPAPTPSTAWQVATLVLAACLGPSGRRWQELNRLQPSLSNAPEQRSHLYMLIWL